MNYLIYSGIFNAAVFLLYGLDKLLAVVKARRIPESILITLAAVCGGAGAMCGMVLFRHKTSKPKFRYTIPILFIVQAVLFLWLHTRGITL